MPVKQKKLINFHHKIQNIQIDLQLDLAIKFKNKKGII